MTRRPAVLTLTLTLILAGCAPAYRDDTAQPGAGSHSPSLTPPAEPSLDAAGTDFRTETFTRGQRRLETTIVWPKAPGRYPIVLFGHGLGGIQPLYGELLKHWAAAGFVVAAPAFPGTKWGVPKVDIRDVPNQPADLRAVLDGLLALDSADPLRRRIDPTRVAAAGHSAGGITTLGLFTGDGRDDRIDAGIIMAGNSLGVGERFNGQPVPLLFVHTEADPVVPTSTGRSAYRAVPWPKAFLTLPGKEHAAPYMLPGDPSFPVVAEATTDFLRWALAGDTTARDRLARTSGLESKL